MILARREFLKLLGVAAGTVGVGACDGRWRVPDRLVELAQRGPGLESFKNTVCGLCQSGCGLTVRLVDGLPVGLRGNPRHPLNRGGLCPVGQAGLEVLYAPDRLTTPLRRTTDGGYEEIDWETALGEITGRLTDLAAAGRGHRLAVLTEEPGRLFNDLAGRFTHALGSPNFAHLGDGAALGYQLTQGVAEVPGFDLGESDLVLSFGLDLFEDGEAPLHAIAALVGARETAERAQLLQVTTRLSPSATKANERCTILPGTYAAFALGVAHVLVREGAYDEGFVREHTFGFDDFTDADGRQRLGFRRLLLERYYPDRVASLCGCEPGIVIAMARRLARAARPVALAGGEAALGSNATWTVMAVHSLNALLGAFDRPGGVVLPPPIALTPLETLATPEPGGEGSLFRRQGGAGMLGVDPVEALAAAGEAEAPPVEVLLIAGANPVYDSPAGQRLRQAMERIPLVVALAPFLDETAAAADLVLPTPTFLEGWQGTTTPGGTAFSTVGVSPPVVEPLFETRHSADVLLELGRRVGGAVAAALPWASYEDYLRHRVEGLVISAQGSVISGSFEESWVHFLEERGWRFLERSGAGDFWRDLTREAGWWNPVRTSGDWPRLFPTPSGRFELFSQRLEEELVALGSAGGDGGDREAALDRGIADLGLEAAGDEACHPHHEGLRTEGEGELTLLPIRPLTARGRLGAVSPMVAEMLGYAVATGWQTWAEIAPETAHELHLHDGDIVAVESERGSFEAVIREQPGSVPGAVHVPRGLGHREGFGAGSGSGANPVAALLPVHDPLSGALAQASTRVRLRLVRRRPHGGPAPMEGGVV